MNTYSKNFKDYQIKYVTYEDGKKVIHLKMGVKKRWYGDHLNYDSMSQIINIDTIFKLNEAHKRLKKEEEY